MRTPRPAAPLALLATLYFAQALPLGFFQQALPVLLRQGGLSLALSGAAGLVALPWAVKFLWAPGTDRFLPSARARRRAIAGLQVLAALLALGAALLPPTTPRELAALLVLLFALNLVCATQDIATDALAVALLPPAARGPANGLQTAGYQVGTFVGGGLLLLLAPWLGWAGMLGGLAALLLLPLATGLLRSTPAEATTDAQALAQAAAAPPPTRGLAALRAYMARPGAGAWLWAVALFLLGNFWALAAFRLFLADAGLGPQAIGLVWGVGGMVAGAAGALAGGALLAQRPREWVLGAGGLAVAAGLGALALAGVLVPAPWPVALLCALGWANKAAGGLAGAALFTAMMDRTRPQHPGADFTLQQSVFNIATISSAGAGAAAGALGYGALWALAALAALGGLWVVLRGARALPPEPAATSHLGSHPESPKG